MIRQKNITKMDVQKVKENIATLTITHRMDGANGGRVVSEYFKVDVLASQLLHMLRGFNTHRVLSEGCNDEGEGLEIPTMLDVSLLRIQRPSSGDAEVEMWKREKKKEREDQRDAERVLERLFEEFQT